MRVVQTRVGGIEFGHPLPAWQAIENHNSVFSVNGNGLTHALTVDALSCNTNTLTARSEGHEIESVGMTINSGDMIVAGTVVIAACAVKSRTRAIVAGDVGGGECALTRPNLPPKLHGHEPSLALAVGPMQLVSCKSSTAKV
jgi:hypothetical protein